MTAPSGRAKTATMTQPGQSAAPASERDLRPIQVYSVTAPASWMDYNGHMNAAAYAHAFDQAMDAFLQSMHLGEDYVRREGGALFTIQNHITYQREVREGDNLTVSLQLIDLDAKRVHVFLRLMNTSTGMQAAVSELLSMHVDLTDRRSCPFPPEIHHQLEGLLKAHTGLARPVELGRAIGIRARSRQAPPPSGT